jgi:hypothetical protein
MLLLIVLLATTSACDRLPFGKTGKNTRLSDKEFVEVYVKLAQATSPEEKARILQQAGTSAEELEEFVKVYLDDLPALSQVFDTVVARIGNSREQDLPALPGR